MAIDLPAPSDWARGRQWIWRAPLLVWVGYIAFLFFGEFMTSAELSRYVGDARTLQLDLVSMGEAAAASDVTGHDWPYLLMKTHLLQRDVSIAASCRFMAWIILLASALFGAWLLWRMTSRRPTA